MRHKTDPAAIAAYLSLLEQTNGQRQIQTRKNMRTNIFTALPGETEAQARERLALERGDFRTDLERAEDRLAATLRDLRENSNNPNL